MSFVPGVIAAGLGLGSLVSEWSRSGWQNGVAHLNRHEYQEEIPHSGEYSYSRPKYSEPHSSKVPHQVIHAQPNRYNPWRVHTYPEGANSFERIEPETFKAIYSDLKSEINTRFNRKLTWRQLFNIATNPSSFFGLPRYNNIKGVPHPNYFNWHAISGLGQGIHKLTVASKVNRSNKHNRRVKYGPVLSKTSVPSRPSTRKASWKAPKKTSHKRYSRRWKH